MRFDFRLRSVPGVNRPRTTRSFLSDALKRSAAAARQRRLVVVETTTLDIERGEPAIAHVRAALPAARM